MGSWVSASFGYGIALPNGDDYDSEYVPNEWVKEVSRKWAEEDAPEDYVDWGEVAEKIGLPYDSGYVHDYGQGYVVFGSKPVSSYDTVKSFTPAEVDGALLADVGALKEAAEKIGIPFEPAYFLVVSYG